jgi:hypothetical protein
MSNDTRTLEKSNEIKALKYDLLQKNNTQIVKYDYFVYKYSEPVIIAHVPNFVVRYDGHWTRRLSQLLN